MKYLEFFSRLRLERSLNCCTSWQANVSIYKFCFSIIPLSAHFLHPQLDGKKSLEERTVFKRLSNLNLLLRTLVVIFIFSGYGCDSQKAKGKNQDGSAGDLKKLSIEHYEDTGKIDVYRKGGDEPVLTLNAREDFRPYIHPIIAPDGQGVLTQFSPGHHPHQTGLYLGFTQVNGRDFFHNPGGDYWQRVSFGIREDTDSESQMVAWHTAYDLLDEDGYTMLSETQNWSMSESDGEFVLELQWQGEAKTDVTISKYAYGGLFLRMPWKEGISAEVQNSEGDRNHQAEGSRARWIDLGMQVDGRSDFAHIAIFDHSQNRGFPISWRVDRQMGVGSATTRTEDWHLVEGQIVTICYRFKIYTGEFSNRDLNTEWEEYVAGSSMCSENK